MRTTLIAVVASLAILAACSSGGDQTAVPPPSPDTGSGVAGDDDGVGVAEDLTRPTDPSTIPPTSLASTTTLPPDTTVPETTAPATTVPAPSRPTIDEMVASGDVLNIAHAGGDQEWPHSTFYAYDQAVAAGADVLEMDVQLTGDGVLIVQHDDTVDKTTNASGPVTDFTFDEITRLDAGYWFAEGCWPCRDLPDDAYLYRGVRTGDVPPPAGAEPDDFRIVSFAEVVERYPGMPLDIEIKGTADAATATAHALADEIEQFGLTEHVVVAATDDAAIESFRAVAPDVAVSPGLGALSAWLLDGVSLDPTFRIVQVPPMYGDVAVITPEFWDAVEVAGVHVWMWPNDAATQENAAFYQEMIDQGVTGIIAGRPSEVPT